MFKPSGNIYVKTARKDPTQAVAQFCAAYAAGFPKAAQKIFSAISRDVTVDDLLKCYDAAFKHGGAMGGRTLFSTDFYTYYFPGGARHLALMQMTAAAYPDYLEAVLHYGSEGRRESEHMCAVLMADNLSDDAKRMFIKAHQAHFEPYYYFSYFAISAPLHLGRALDLMGAAAMSPGQLADIAQKMLLNSKAAPEAIEAGFDMLLSRGMDMHFAKGAVMQAALQNGHISVARKMMEAGFDMPRYAGGIYEELCNAGGSPAGIDYMRQYGPAGQGPRPSPATGGYVRLNEESVAVEHKLPDGTLLTTVFNFATRQQVLIAQNATAISAPTVVPFSQVESRAALVAAATAFVAAGGDKAKTADLMPAALAKPRGL